MNMITLPATAILASLNNLTRTVCKPLNRLQIATFNYLKVFKDGSSIDLSTDVINVEPFTNDHSIYLKQALLFNPCHIEKGFFEWSNFNKNMQNFLYKKFASDVGVTIIQKYNDYCDIYHFVYNHKQPEIRYTEAMNQEILKIFILYFKDKAKKTIRLAEKHKIFIPNYKFYLNEHNHCETAWQYKDFNMEKFINELNINRYYLPQKNNDVYLTKQEIICLKWATIGKTAEEIAMILNISKRTCERHLEHIKDKLNCPRQLMLGFNLAKYIPELLFERL